MRGPADRERSSVTHDGSHPPCRTTGSSAPAGRGTGVPATADRGTGNRGYGVKRRTSERGTGSSNARAYRRRRFLLGHNPLGFTLLRVAPLARSLRRSTKALRLRSLGSVFAHRPPAAAMACTRPRTSLAQRSLSRSPTAPLAYSHCSLSRSPLRQHSESSSALVTTSPRADTHYYVPTASIRVASMTPNCTPLVLLLFVRM